MQERGCECVWMIGWVGVGWIDAYCRQIVIHPDPHLHYCPFQTIVHVIVFWITQEPNELGTCGFCQSKLQTYVCQQNVVCELWLGEDHCSSPKLDFDASFLNHNSKTTFITSDNIIHTFWPAAIQLFEHFRAIVHMVLFLSFCQRMRHPTTCYLSQANILMKNRFNCCRSNLQDVLYLLVCDMWINIDQLTDSFDVFWSDCSSRSTITRFIFEVCTACIFSKLHILTRLCSKSLHFSMEVSLFEVCICTKFQVRIRKHGVLHWPLEIRHIKNVIA